MSEFMGTGSGYGSQNTELYVKRVLAGSAESVRPRLAAALERLGYDVIEDEPELRGRRGARGWGTWYGSADVLDYAMALVIRLKPVGAHSTRATFDYTIAHPWLSGGEKEVLAREAEALAALATIRAADKICAACGTESTDDSRFCRRCGAPMTSAQAEIEVLRLTAEGRAGHTSVVTSAILSFATMLIALFSLFTVWAGKVGTKGGITLAVIFGVMSLINLLVTSCAWSRLNRALRPKRGEAPALVGGGVMPEPAFAAHDVVGALPPRAARASVTEGTTELLDAPPPRERMPVAARRDERDADPLH
ncbi:MAG: hypothetical protein ACRD9R_02665 [Pyrinomonadaceae bacterium]